MRVERSLDKLRALLVGRGFASTSAALAGLLTAEAGVAAPAGMSATVASAALAGSFLPVAVGVGAGAGGMLQTLAFMSTAKSTVIVGAAVLCAVGAGLYYSAAARESHRELASVQLRAADLQSRITGQERDLRAVEQQVASVDRDSADLLKTAQGAVASAATAEAEAKIPITNDLVKVRYEQAKALQQSGQWEAALREFLWCFDVGMPQVASFAGVRTSAVLMAIQEIAAHDPEALAELRARRDRAGQQILAGVEMGNAFGDFSTINRTLGEDDKTLQVFDQLPAGDTRRRTMSIYAYDVLLANRRYADVAVGRPYAMISSLFEANLGLPASLSATPGFRENVAQSTARDIEVLAGIDDLEHARALIARLLNYSDAESTKLAIREHVERAGHPELAAGLAKP